MLNGKWIQEKLGGRVASVPFIRFSQIIPGEGFASVGEARSAFAGAKEIEERACADELLACAFLCS
jgi:hypothetical protein